MRNRKAKNGIYMKISLNEVNEFLVIIKHKPIFLNQIKDT